MEARPPLRTLAHQLPQHISRLIALRGQTRMSVEEHRLRQFDIIERISQRFSVQGVGPRVDLLAHLSILARSPDTELGDDAHPGLSLIGEQNPTGLWTAKANPPRISPDELQHRIRNVLKAHQHERSRGQLRLPSRGQRREMLKQLRQEQKRGWWEPEALLEDVVARFNNEFCLLFFRRQAGVQGQRMRRSRRTRDVVNSAGNHVHVRLGRYHRCLG